MTIILIYKNNIWLTQFCWQYICKNFKKWQFKLFYYDFVSPIKCHFYCYLLWTARRDKTKANVTNPKRYAGKILTSFEMSMTPESACFTSCLPTVLLNSCVMSSIFALAAKFFALFVKFLSIIWNCITVVTSINSFPILFLYSKRLSDTWYIVIDCKKIYNNT